LAYFIKYVINFRVNAILKGKIILIFLYVNIYEYIYLAYDLIL